MCLTGGPHYNNLDAVERLRRDDCGGLRVIRLYFGWLTWLTSSYIHFMIIERKLVLPLTAHLYVILQNEGDMCPSVHPSVQRMQSDTIIIIGDWTLISGRKFVGQNCWAFPTWELRVWWICIAQVNAPGCMPGRRETLQQFRLLRSSKVEIRTNWISWSKETKALSVIFQISSSIENLPS